MNIIYVHLMHQYIHFYWVYYSKKCKKNINFLDFKFRSDNNGLGGVLSEQKLKLPIAKTFLDFLCLTNQSNIFLRKFFIF